MTDADKLQLIEAIAREAFADKWQGAREQVITAHRLQALANIFALFEYDGITAQVFARDLKLKPLAVTDVNGEEVITDDGQITFDDLLSPCYNAEEELI